MAAVEVVFRLMVMQLVFDVHNVASRFWSQSLPSRTNAQLFVWHAALVEKVWSISRCPVCNLLVCGKVGTCILSPIALTMIMCIYIYTIYSI